MPKIVKNKDKKLEKLASLNTVNGKDKASKCANPRTMNDIWGISSKNFKDKSEFSLRARLSKLNKVDLQNECIEKGIMPYDSRERMVEKITEAYRKEVTFEQMRNVKPVEFHNKEEIKAALSKLKM